MGNSGLSWRREANLKGPTKLVPGRAVSEKTAALAAAGRAGGEPAAVIYSWALLLHRPQCQPTGPRADPQPGGLAEEVQAYAEGYLQRRSGLKQSSQLPFTTDKPYLGRLRLSRMEPVVSQRCSSWADSGLRKTPVAAGWALVEPVTREPWRMREVLGPGSLGFLVWWCFFFILFYLNLAEERRRRARCPARC